MSEQLRLSINAPPVGWFPPLGIEGNGNGADPLADLDMAKADRERRERERQDEQLKARQAPASCHCEGGPISEQNFDGARCVRCGRPTTNAPAGDYTAPGARTHKENPMSHNNDKAPTGSNGLRAALESAMAEESCSMKDLTVLANQNDPFRTDTPAGHRDGEWLAMRFEETGRERLHLRGIHYTVLGKAKPDGTKYTNTDENWTWLQSKAGKAARWLGYLPFEAITDERNAEPVVKKFEWPDPTAWISAGEVAVEFPEELEPQPWLADFRGVQPYRLVLFGEKRSLEDVLAPVAKARHADLYLPTGNASDTMVEGMARDAAEDGRPLVVFYFSDCDPAGWNMAVEVARKLQACRALKFPELDFQVRPVALTPDQGREYDLPVTPLKDNPQTKKRDAKWRRVMGVEQTEIDALATLQPDLLRQIAMKATRPFFDAGLDDRVKEIRIEWYARALQVLEDGLGEEQLASLRREAEAKLAEVEEKIGELNDALRVSEGEVEGIELPEIPEIPEGEAPGVEGLPSPLIASSWGFAEQSRRLKAHKAFEVE